MSRPRQPLNRADCLICGDSDPDRLTLEHIIPQTLWARFGVDPNQDGDVRKTHTTLCRRCNGATARLHTREAMFDLLETGTPATEATVSQMADWVFWVLLLIELERGDTVVPADEIRQLLRARFVRKTTSSIPKGWRLYAAHTSTLASHGRDVESFEVVTAFDSSGYKDSTGALIGFTTPFGLTMQSALTIGIGKIGFLVLPPTVSSGPGHLDRVDAAAARGGLERISPRRGASTSLTQGNADVGSFGRIFVPPFAGDNRSTLPEQLRKLIEKFTSG